MAAFLRRTFIPEPELNPQPTWNNPAAFFFLRTVYTLGVLGLSLIALRKRSVSDESRTLAWFVIVLFALSPNEASYTFVLLLPAVALLLDGARRAWSAILIALYVAVELPLFRWDAALFPKAWLMLALFLVAGWPFLQETPALARWTTVLAVVSVSLAATVANMRSYRIETAQTMRPAIVEPHNIYAGWLTLGAAGWINEAIADERYLFRESTTNGTRTLKFDGDAFHPSATRQGRMIAFELVANGKSHIELLDQNTKEMRTVARDVLNPREPALSADGTKLAFVAGDSLYLSEGSEYRVIAVGEISNPAFFPDNSRIVFSKGRPGKRSIQSISISSENMRTLVAYGDCFQPAVSPNGQLLAYACSATGGRHIWIEDLTSMTSRRLTSGNCNNESPAWDGDSQSIIFASDCSRGLGLSALYRAPICSRTATSLDVGPPSNRRP
jgi:WD40-like Beta Propeller Repeat